MPKLLTTRKAKWVDQFKPKKIEGTPLNPNASAEQRYFSQLRALVEIMTNDVEKKLERFFKEPHSKEFFAEDATVSSQARILANALQKKFDALFALQAKPLAEGMVDDADKSSAVSLKSSLKELSGGLTLKTDILTGPLNDVISATVSENVSLIKSIASQYLDGVQGAVMRSITTGNGLADLVPFLQNHKGITLRRARIIAYDQTRKAYNNINKGRMEKLGLEEYKWLHSAGGQHPRELHESYSGKIFRFDNPPIIDKRTGERGIPGQAINCRCRMVPVIRFEGE